MLLLRLGIPPASGRASRLCRVGVRRSAGGRLAAGRASWSTHADRACGAGAADV